jgi:hypothetical protein
MIVHPYKEGDPLPPRRGEDSEPSAIPCGVQKSKPKKRSKPKHETDGKLREDKAEDKQ